jgi:hypothetical protein
VKLVGTLRKCWEALRSKRDHAANSVRIGMLQVSIEERDKEIDGLRSTVKGLLEEIETLKSQVRIQDIERTKLAEVCSRDLARVMSEREAMPHLVMAPSAAQKQQVKLTIAADDAREPNVA